VQLTDSSPKRDSSLKWRRALLFVAAWTFIALVFATISFAASLSENNNRGLGFSSALKLNFVLFYLWGILSLLIFWFSRRFPIEIRPFQTRNLLLHIFALIVFAVGHQFAHLTTLWFVMPRLRQQFPSVAECYRVYFGLGFYVDLLIATMIVIGVHAFLYYRRFRAGQLEQAALKAQLAQAQLRALKMQLHPHFLFNTLHSISSLVLEDPPKANSMIARLGDFLRLTLDHSNQQSVTLEEETQFVRCYLEIEQVRFGDRLEVQFQIDPAALGAEVPHLILQPVVENAIQHAIAPRASPGRITIAARRLDDLLHLEVRDSGPGLKNDDDSPPPHGVGLNNVRARLEGLYGRDFKFELSNGTKEGLAVVIQIPFVLNRA
jgi:two-component system, LytTR family, sensor kinase